MTYVIHSFIQQTFTIKLLRWNQRGKKKEHSFVPPSSIGKVLNMHIFPMKFETLKHVGQRGMHYKNGESL